MTTIGLLARLTNLEGDTDDLEKLVGDKAPKHNPSFTGTVNGVSKSMVGLGNVDNTSDADKTISDDTQEALNLKAPLASPSFTGTVTVDVVKVNAIKANTSDANPTIYIDNHLICQGNESVNGDVVNVNDIEAQGTVTMKNLTVTDGASLHIEGDVVLNGDVAIPSPNTLFVKNITPPPDAELQPEITVNGNLKVDNGVLTVPDTVQATFLNTIGTGGLTVRTSSNAPIVKFWDTGLSQFSQRVRFDGPIDGDLAVNTGSKLIVDKIKKTTVDQTAVTIDDDCIVNGQLMVNGTNVLTALGDKANITDTVTQNQLQTVYTGGTQNVNLGAGFSYRLPWSASGQSVGMSDGSTYTEVDLKAPIKIQRSTDASYIATFANDGPTFTGTVVADNLRANTGIQSDVIRATTASQVTIDDSLTVTGVVATNTLSARDANEVTVNGDFAVSGALLVDTITTSEANQISINDNVTISGATVANNLLVNGTLSFGGSSSITGITKEAFGLGNVDNTSDASKPLSSATVSALSGKADKTTTYTKTEVDQTFSNLIDSAPVALNTLKELAAALGDDANYATTVQNQMAGKAPLSNPTFTGTVVADNLRANSSVISNTIQAYDAAAVTVNDSLTITGVVAANTLSARDANDITINDSLVVTGILASNTLNAFDANEMTVDDNLTVTGNLVVGTTNILTTMSNKQNSLTTGTAVGAEPILSGTTVKGIKGGANITLSSDSNVVTIAGPDLTTYAPNANPTFTRTVSGITKAMVGLGNVDNTTDALKPISQSTQAALDSKAPLASPTFTGTVSGITKAMVGLGNVDNTSDASKPVSTATQTALNLKAPLSSPTFTGTINGANLSLSGVGAGVIDCVTANATTVNAGQIQTSTGYLSAPKLKFPGTTANDSIVIENNLGSEVARFYNVYRCRMNGNTTILGDASVSGTLYTAGPVTFNQSLAVDTIQASTANRLTVQDNLTVTGNLIVNGTSNISGGSSNPYWVSGKVDGSAAGVAPTTLTSKGVHNFTCVRNPNQAVGVFDVSWTTPHPDGTNFVVFVNGEGGGWSELINGIPNATYGNTATKFTVFFRKLYQSGEGLVDCPFTFFVLA
jgi:hypothetical protein